MKSFCGLVLLSLLFLATGWPQLPVSASTLTLKTSTTQLSSDTPVILYAQWIGKSLSVEGANFAEGASIIVDGQRLKTANAENAPSFFLFAKKAKKKIARNQAITLHVQNPDGQTSDAFPFFSGFLLTMDDSGTVLHLNVGDRFLLFLPPHGDPPTVGWTVSISGSDPIAPDPTAMMRNTNDLPIPRSQGFFEAVHPGLVSIIADASPLCPPLPPEQCVPRGAQFGHFDLVVFVDK